MFKLDKLEAVEEIIPQQYILTPSNIQFGIPCYYDQ